MTKGRRLRVVGYLRVSTDLQAERGLGLDVQEAAIRAWTKDHGHKLIGFHTDSGISGSNGLDTRLGLADALGALKDRTADGLIVYRLDRLARDLIVQETLLAEVKRMGAQVFSTSPAEDAYLADDPDDPSRKLIRQVLGAVAEYERSMIRLRLMAGAKQKASRGGYAWGAPPMGYRAEGRELVADEREQATVARIMELHRQGMSTRKISAQLASEGHKPKRAETFAPITIGRIIKRTPPDS